MAEETAPNQESAAPESAAPESAAPESAAPPDPTPAPEAAPKKKKEKPPALEDKPFEEYIQQHYIPALQTGLEEQGIRNAELAFVKAPIAIAGLSGLPDCWQVRGEWESGTRQTRKFSVYFFDETLKGQKGFACTEAAGETPSTLESFLIDERKIDLGLLVFGTLQRLNAQKWLERN